MKVLLINGSPHQKGCTYTALAEVAKTLEENGVNAEIAWIGTGAVHGCIACGKCGELGRCVFSDDACNELCAKAQEADGLIVGSPVYYAAPNGALLALFQRLFYSGSAALSHKPGACVVSARRAGATASLDALQTLAGTWPGCCAASRPAGRRGSTRPGRRSPASSPISSAEKRPCAKTKI